MTPIASQLSLLDTLKLPGMPEPLPVPCVDNHTHLDATRDYSGLEVSDNLALAEAVGITRFVQVGCDVPSSQFAVELAARDPRVVASVAIHPNDAARAGDQLDSMIDAIAAMATRPGVRAIGETGLDYYRTTDADAQLIQAESFAAHLEIAAAHDLTVVIHDRDAHADVLSVLASVTAPKRVVMHCFSGDAEFAQACLDRGYWLSFPGVITYKSAQPQRDALQITPLDRILVETDAPYLTPVPARGKANAPYLLPHTIRFIAEQRGLPLAELCEQIVANTDAAYGGSWGA